MRTTGNLLEPGDLTGFCGIASLPEDGIHWVGQQLNLLHLPHLIGPDITKALPPGFSFHPHSRHKGKSTTRLSYEPAEVGLPQDLCGHVLCSPAPQPVHSSPEQALLAPTVCSGASGDSDFHLDFRLTLYGLQVAGGYLRSAGSSEENT